MNFNTKSELIFTFFYILLCVFIIYPTKEFISVGLTIDHIFASILGSEKIDFVRYHQKRTSVTLCVHAFLPGLYLLIHYLQYSENYNDHEMPIVWVLAQKFSVLPALFAITLTVYWAQNNWEKHPISLTLSKFSNSDSTYTSVAGDINAEFRRDDILHMNMNSISKVIATENWVMKTTPYNVNFSHQSDTTLIVNKSETYDICEDTLDPVQILNILVKPLRSGVNEFSIRINALDLRLLEDRISRPITIPSNIHFHRSTIDRFIEVFKEQVALNPVVIVDSIIESCFACMLSTPDVKIQKQCLDVDEDGLPIPNDRRCRNCYCRPMWCVECLARWFASRQHDVEKDVWLQQKCTCPLCRTPFCIFDVCYIQRREV